MIQRIQSLYILLYIINKSFLLYLSIADKSSFHLYINKFDVFFFLLMLSLIISTFTIFSFKNRKIQIKLSYILISIQSAALLLILNQAFQAFNTIIFLKNYQIFLYILGLVLLLLSLRGIKKDQKLIESIDRIR